MARKYETKYGTVVVREYPAGGMLRVVGVLVRDGMEVNSTECEIVTDAGSSEENKQVRHMVAESVLDKYKHSKRNTHTEIATNVAGIVHKRIAMHR